MTGLEDLVHTIVVVDPDPVVQRNTGEAIARTLGNKYFKVVTTDAYSCYGDEVNRSGTSFVVLNYSMPWLKDPVRELDDLNRRNIPVIMTLDDEAEVGNVISIGQQVPIAGYRTKPPPSERGNSNARFYTDLGKDSERCIHRLPRVNSTVGIIGVGRIGQQTAYEIAAKANGLGLSKSGKKDSPVSPVQYEPVKLILYNHGTRREYMKQAKRVAETIASRGNTNISVHIADDLQAIAANAGFVVMSYGSLDREIKHMRTARSLSRSASIHDTYPSKAVATKEIYSAMSPYATIIHATNPVESLVMLGRLFLRENENGMRRNVEGFVLNDYYRVWKLLAKWGEDLSKAVFHTQVYDITLDMIGVHHLHTDILKAQMNNVRLDLARQWLNKEEITKQTLVDAVRDSVEKVLQANGHAATETAVHVLELIRSITANEKSYAAIHFQPTDYEIFMRGGTTIQNRTMSMKEYWRTQFPKGVVFDVPIKRRQGLPYPDGEALNVKMQGEERRKLTQILANMRNIMIKDARARIAEDPSFRKVLEFYELSA